MMTATESKLKILVVDDDRDGAYALAMVLRMLGHDAAIAYDGPSAVRIATDLTPNLILLDIGMPEMDGLDVCRAIRQTSEGQSMMIVAQTGWGQEADVIRTVDAGFDAHLVKPVNRGHLKEILNAAFLKARRGLVSMDAT